ncbi:hypothetical protein Cni_G13424 [Canna indica]|uniref:Uncharacterized protein n=1 Tax=Canna indica TaxID=4628 RepID=A0AAQ3K9V1_9LILI|nr:hypothetical protein Cni_G13424 [Canna indica]
MISRSSRQPPPVVKISGHTKNRRLLTTRLGCLMNSAQAYDRLKRIQIIMNLLRGKCFVLHTKNDGSRAIIARLITRRVITARRVVVA